MTDRWGRIADQLAGPWKKRVKQADHRVKAVDAFMREEKIRKFWFYIDDTRPRKLRGAE